MLFRSDVSADEPIDACTLCDVWNWSVETGTWEKTATTWDASDQSACGRLIDDVDTSDYVGVFVSANYKPITGISAPVLGGNRLLARSTTMRLEPVAPMALDDPC